MIDKESELGNNCFEIKEVCSRRNNIKLMCIYRVGELARYYKELQGRESIHLNGCENRNIKQRLAFVFGNEFSWKGRVYIYTDKTRDLRIESM